MAKELKQYIANMGIIIKNIPVKAHLFIGMVKRYYRLLQQVYSIIIIEILGIEPELTLQMSFKAINDLVGPNRPVLTLLVFEVYPKITKFDALSPSITQRGIALKKTIDEV